MTNHIQEQAANVNKDKVRVENLPADALAIDLSKYIEVRIFDEATHIRNRRIPVAVIVYNAYNNNWDVPYLAWSFSLSEAEVLAALLYYQQHKEVIDTLAGQQAAKDEMYRLYGEKGMNASVK